MSTQKLPIRSKSDTHVPRNFVLLNSLDRQDQFTHVQFGLAEDSTGINYVKLEMWDCTIIYDDGNDLNIFELKLKVPLNFPDVPPVATFDKKCIEHSRINRLCNQDGTLNSTYQSAIASDWNSKTMEIPEYLVWLYNKIRNR